MVAYSFKKRFVVPIQIGLGLPVPEAAALAVRPKRQTIRAIGKRRHARPGEEVQLYQGQRTKDCFKIGTAICTTVRPIIIDIKHQSLRVILDGRTVQPQDIDCFVLSDGFANVDDMIAFWQAEHPGNFFEGVCIQWLPRSP